MRFSCRWFAEYVEVEGLPAAEAGAEDRIDELARRLTGLGFNVEGIEKGVDGTDWVLDIDVTTNRPDCMNHLGLARELAALFSRPLKRPLCAPERETETSTGAAIQVSIEDSEGCLRYAARVVEGVRVGASPEWLAGRLRSIGVRPINNVVDVTNFVLWELGQPIHAFDLDRLSGPEIRVRRARPGERLVTLDGVERELVSEDLVIADRERPVALAGIMGGQESEVSPATRRVLLESAYFDRRRVRLSARRLGLHTDASHRFERGADPEISAIAAGRAVRLIAETAGGEVLATVIDVRAGASPKVSWRLEHSRLEAFAGYAIAAPEVERILAALEFAPRLVDPSTWEGEVPSFRLPDFEPREVKRQRRLVREAYPQDLYEEILRFQGYDRAAATLPAVAGFDPGESPEHSRRARIRRHLAACGCTEAINFAFHEQAADRAFPALARNGPALTLANPLSERYGILRRSLLPNLLASAEFNWRRGAESVRLFEIGHLFPGREEPELEAVAVVAGGRPGVAWDRRSQIDLLDLKGVIESLAEALGAPLVARPAALAGFLSGTAAELLETAGGKAVGFIGQVARLEAPYPIFVAEIATAALGGEEQETRGLRLPSRFPGVAADLTLTHPLSVSWSELALAIAKAETPDLADFGLKDRYQGVGVPPGAVNTTIHFLYSAADRSLTQEEVNSRHAALAAELERRFGVRKEESE